MQVSKTLGRKGTAFPPSDLTWHFVFSRKKELGSGSPTQNVASSTRQFVFKTMAAFQKMVA